MSVQSLHRSKLADPERIGNVSFLRLKGTVFLEQKKNKHDVPSRPACGSVQCSARRQSACLEANEQIVYLLGWEQSDGNRSLIPGEKK